MRTTFEKQETIMGMNRKNKYERGKHPALFRYQKQVIGMIRRRGTFALFDEPVSVPNVVLPCPLARRDGDTVR